MSDLGKIIVGLVLIVLSFFAAMTGLELINDGVEGVIELNQKLGE